MSTDDLIPVSIIALLEEPATGSPVVILHEPDSNRVLPIWIGEVEARAIAVAFQGVEMPRPLTHALMKNVILELGANVEHVVIERVEAGTYFASIDLDIGENDLISVDARPSDSIALALEFGAPIFIARSILEMAGQDNPFPSAGKDPKPAKQKFTEQELRDLKVLLKKAREREQGSEE